MEAGHDSTSVQGTKKVRWQPLPLDDTSQQWEQTGIQWDQNHPVWIVEQAVRRLDCQVLNETYRGCGSPAYRPDIMLRLALYETMRGVGSPARWALDAKENQPLQWLLRGTTPSVRACYRFRDRLGDVIEALHQEIIRGVREDNLLEADPETAAQDGSFHRACASRHRLVNQDQLEKRRQQLEAAMHADAEGQDPLEAAPYWMPRTATGRANLLDRMDKAEEILNQRLEANAQRRKSHRLDPKHVCVSLSDPEAAISRDKEKVFCPLYTAQYMTDYQSGLVLGFQVTGTATDVGTLIPLIDKTQPLVGSWGRGAVGVVAVGVVSRFGMFRA